MKREETILCSAIKVAGVNDIYDGIYLGHRHHDFASMTKLRLITKAEESMRVLCLVNNTQGFLTSNNRFVNRKEAFLIAKNANQIEESKHKKELLFSEYLY